MPRFSPNRRADIQRLIMARDRAYDRELEPFRTNRNLFQREIAGYWYGENGTPDERPVNLMEMAANVFQAHFVAKNPRYIITTPIDELRADAALLAADVNQTVVEIELEATLRAAVFEALTFMGIIKIALPEDGDKNARPYALYVSPDDWVHDTTAKKLKDAFFWGNKFRVPLEELRESDLYDKKLTRRMEPTRRGSLDGYSESLDRLSQAAVWEHDELVEYCDVWDIWIPSEGVIVTLPGKDQGVDDALAVVEWEGPEHGPYRTLTFGDVPDNILPAPPASHWMTNQKFINAMYRKIHQQALRQKKLTLGHKGNPTDNEAVLNANDGEFVQVEGAELAQEVAFGGVDQVNFATAIHMKDLFVYLAGNLDVLGGLSPQSKTLGQDQMLAQNASQRVALMQHYVTKFAEGIGRDLAWYSFHDEHRTREVVRVYEDLELPAVIKPGDLRGKWLDYNFSIDPYSMQYQSPGQKVATITQILQGLVIPALPLFQEQGITINLSALMRVLAEYTNIDELNEIIVSVDPNPEAGTATLGNERKRPRAPAVTHRNTTRTNVSANSRQSRDQQMMQSLLGGAGGPLSTAMQAG